MSPPSPPHADPELELAPSRLSKEELIQNMDRVDREITMVEQQISKLKKKQVSSEGGSPGDRPLVLRCLEPRRPAPHPQVPGAQETGLGAWSHIISWWGVCVCV